MSTHLSNAQYTGRQYLRGMLGTHIKGIEGQLRTFAHDRNWAGHSFTGVDQPTWTLAQSIGFRLSISFSGYGVSGNDRLWDEKSTEIFLKYLYTKDGALFRCLTDDSSKHLGYAPADWTFMSSHDSCWYDGMDDGVFEMVDAEIEAMIPSGYWEHPKHQKDPISFFIWSNWGADPKLLAVQRINVAKREGNINWSEPAINAVKIPHITGTKSVTFRHDKEESQQIVWGVKEAA